MQQPIAAQVKATAIAAGWSESGARWAVLKIQSAQAAQEIVAAAATVPESIRAVILQDPRHTTDAALVVAFREASEIRMLCGLPYMSSIPADARRLESFVHGNGSNRRLMTAAEAREKLTNALAETDQHIDTARPVNSIEDAAARVYANRAAKSEVRK